MYAVDFPAGITVPSTCTVVLHEQMRQTPCDLEVEITAGEPEWDDREDSPPPTDNPNVAYCTCTTTARRPDLAVFAGATFEILPGTLSPAAFLAFGDRPWITTSAADGSLQASLPRRATSRYWGPRTFDQVRRAGRGQLRAAVPIRWILKGGLACNRGRRLLRKAGASVGDNRLSFYLYRAACHLLPWTDRGCSGPSSWKNLLATVPPRRPNVAPVCMATERSICWALESNRRSVHRVIAT